jgi:hypothetical protein
MFKGQVNFRADFPGFAFESVDIATHQENTGGATVRSTLQDGIRLTVKITKADTKEEAIQTAGKLANHVAKVLTYQFDHHFRTFVVDAHALVEEKDGSQPVHHIGQSIGVFVKVEEQCHNLGAQKTAEIKGVLEKPKHAGYLFYGQFRAALSLPDPLARFMSLYSIVLSLSNDAQEDVDILALKLDGGTPTNAPYRARKSGTPETVYTRLRNQVGHVRAGTTIEGTRAEMEKWIPGLIRMAKHLIDRQP